MKAPWIKRPKAPEPETVRIEPAEKPETRLTLPYTEFNPQNGLPHTYTGPSKEDIIAGLRRENELNLDAIRGLAAENKGLHGKLAIATRDLEEAQKELNSREVENEALRRTLELDERIFSRLSIPKPKGKRR